MRRRSSSEGSWISRWRESTSSKAAEYERRPAILGVALDVTERNRAQRQLNYLAFYDPLTELPNRALFLDRLGQELARCKRSGEMFGRLLLDLDGFKAVNDTHGHEQEHRKLVEDLLSIQHHMDHASLMVTLQSLKEWLASHITHGDRKLGEALRASGATKSLGLPAVPAIGGDHA